MLLRTAMASRLSTSTTWNRCRPSWPPLTKWARPSSQPSAGARKYAGEPFIKHLIQAATEAYPHIPLVMHQDHGTSPKVCQGAIDLGFGSVMMDGSLMEDGKSPRFLRLQRRSDPQGRRDGPRCRRDRGRRTGLPGNLETGEAGEEDGIGAEGKLDHSQMLTDPEEAAVFVKATQLTPWPSPSAPATAPTNSAASPRATSWPSRASRKSTLASRTPTW